MSKRKLTKKYYFSVEGDTEKWYLDWLCNQINNSESSKYKVAFHVDIEKDPIKFAKRIKNTGKINVWHLTDYESNEEDHIQLFISTMDKMKKAMELGKQIQYHLGYSNLTFDLWIILHMADCNGSITYRKQYLSKINSAYRKHFESMDDFKKEDHFKGCLKNIDLSNVVNAIHRAERIMQQNVSHRYTLHQYKGFAYYRENPSLTCWMAVKSILIDCGIYND